MKRFLAPALSAVGAGCGALVGWNALGPIGAALGGGFGAVIGALVGIGYFDDTDPTGTT